MLFLSSCPQPVIREVLSVDLKYAGVQDLKTVENHCSIVAEVATTNF